jgi:hypothetical protein
MLLIDLADFIHTLMVLRYYNCALNNNNVS